MRHLPLLLRAALLAVACTIASLFAWVFVQGIFQWLMSQVDGPRGYHVTLKVPTWVDVLLFVAWFFYWANRSDKNHNS